MALLEVMVQVFPVFQEAYTDRWFLSLYATQGCIAMGAPWVLPVDVAEGMLWGLRLTAWDFGALMELSYNLGQVTCPSMPAGKGRVVSNSKKTRVPLWTCRVSFTFKDGGMCPVSCSRWFVPCFMLCQPRLLETATLFLSELRCPCGGGREVEVTQPRVWGMIRMPVASWVVSLGGQS